MHGLTNLKICVIVINKVMRSSWHCADVYFNETTGIKLQRLLILS